VNAILDAEFNQVRKRRDLVVTGTTVHFVSFIQEELSQVSTVLTRDPDN
jgi:hypothetical protein